MAALGVDSAEAMIQLFGGIEESYAWSLKRAIGYDAEDTTSVMFAMRNGMSASMVCSLVTTVSYRLAGFGTKGCAELRPPNPDPHFTPAPHRPPTRRHLALPPPITQQRGLHPR